MQKGNNSLFLSVLSFEFPIILYLEYQDALDHQILEFEAPLFYCWDISRNIVTN